MGVDIVAIARHQLNNGGFDRAPELLKPVLPVIARYGDVLSQKAVAPVDRRVNAGEHSPLRWQWERPDEPGLDEPGLEGPYGVSIWFSENLYSMHLPPRWRTFVGVPHIQHAVTNVCEAITRALGGNKIIYVPDSAYCPSVAFYEYSDCRNIDLLEGMLASKCGPPASSITNIDRELSNEEMSIIHPNWDANQEPRIHESDGYYISILKDSY